MGSSTVNYWYNLLALLGGGKQLARPLAVTYYVTQNCNLNCAYCEDFGARRNGKNPSVPSLEDALKILRVIRTGTDQVILTGGEPLVHPHIDELVRRAKVELSFRKITMLTNAALLHNHEAILPHLDQLVISLDMLDPARWSEVLNTPLAVATRILDNIRTYAQAQRKFGYRMIVNCVLTPTSIDDARQVLAFCKAENLLVSFSPQAVQNWPSYDLLVSQPYKTFLQELIAEKQRGAPVLGSLAYLRTLLDFHPYACYPTLIPRVLPGGEFVYPCRPIEREDNGHGGHPCSLLEVRDWNEAVKTAVMTYGQPPQMCSSCFQQCFAEPSLMQARPLNWLVEWLRYPASRSAGLPTFAPGS